MGHVTRGSLSALVGLALLSAGCGSSSNAHAVAPPPRGTAHVAMKVLEFTPAAIGARVGQKVVWRNDDNSPHNVTYVSGPRFKSSRTLQNRAHVLDEGHVPGNDPLLLHASSVDEGDDRRLAVIR